MDPRGKRRGSRFRIAGGGGAERHCVRRGGGANRVMGGCRFACYGGCKEVRGNQGERRNGIEESREQATRPD